MTLVFGAGWAAQPLRGQAPAQKTAPSITRDSDRDGVPEPRDRCPRTPPATRVDVNGCTDPSAPPVTAAPAAAPIAGAPATPTSPPAATPNAAAPSPTAAQPRADTARPRPTGMPTPSAAAPPAGGGQNVTQAAPSNPTASPGASASPPATVPATPPRVTPAPAAAAAPAAAPVVTTDPTETAGYWIAAYNGRTDADQAAYVRLLVTKVDSAVIGLVETYRNTSGNPVSGAQDPGRLTRREKDRWLRCRNIANDFRTMAEAASLLGDSVAAGPAQQRAMAGLATAFDDLQALESCDVINGMIEAPDRFNPWQANYENEARNFYRDWYLQVRAVHSAAREVARTGRFPVPAAIATTPPYAAAVR